MEAAELIRMRRSIRKFSNKEISEEDMHKLLEAGMSGPSCVNAQDWCFLVVRDRTTLNKMADVNGAPANSLRNAATGILVCGDLSRSFHDALDYWIIDCSIACQNIVLEAAALGIGSVWLGTYPQMDRVNGQKKLFDFPKHVVPHSILALGYPEDPKELQMGSRSGYEASQVHWEQW